MIKILLTVCIGNICRSPMAEAMLRNSVLGVKVHSAGIGALVGNRADATAQLLMQERGLDISDHIAQQLTLSMCKSADLILVMDSEQRRHIEKKYPFSTGKVFRIAEAIKADVPDPYRQDRAAFLTAANLIEQGVGAWAARINKLTEKERQLT